MLKLAQRNECVPNPWVSFQVSGLSIESLPALLARFVRDNSYDVVGPFAHGLGYTVLSCRLPTCRVSILIFPKASSNPDLWHIRTGVGLPFFKGMLLRRRGLEGTIECEGWRT